MTEGHGTCGQPIVREKASPKGANNAQLSSCSPPLGTMGESIRYPQVPFPSVIPPAVIHIRPLWGRKKEVTGYFATLRRRKNGTCDSAAKYPNPKIYTDFWD